MVRLLPGIVHDVGNSLLPVRAALELVSLGEGNQDPRASLGLLDAGRERLSALVRFARGAPESGSVTLADWAGELAGLVRAECARLGVRFRLELPPDVVVEERAREALHAFVLSIAEHLDRSQDAILVRAVASRERVAFTLALGGTPPEETESPIGRTRCVGRRGFVVRVGVRRLDGGAATRCVRRPRVLVLEPADDFGTLTEAVLEEAGYQVDATRGWDLALVDQRVEECEAVRLAELRAAGVPIALLGADGLAHPFDGSALLRYVASRLAP